MTPEPVLPPAGYGFRAIKAAELRDAINALTTFAEIAAYDITAGWPGA